MSEDKEQWIAIEGHLCYHIIPISDKGKKIGWSSNEEHRRSLYALEVARTFEDEFGRASAKDNAEFIVRACNSHGELLEALQALVRVPVVVQILGTNHTEGCNCPMCRARAAIANATRQPQQYGLSG